MQVQRLDDILCLGGTDALLLFPCSISNFTPKVGEKDTQRAIRQAFNVWQTVTPLSFQVGFCCDFLFPTGASDRFKMIQTNQSEQNNSVGSDPGSYDGITSPSYPALDVNVTR